MNTNPLTQKVQRVHSISPAKTCSRCIMDTMDDPKLCFDKDGICNYCKSYDEESRNLLQEGKEGKKLFDNAIAEIKEHGKNKKYDCLIGLSGGIDSSYVAYIAKREGLRPLCIHFDNGWNSELAVSNIHKLVSKLGFDLYTYVIDWEEFKDLQLAYLKASVIDIEVITDHAIYGITYKIAKENNLKYILGGHNIVTEGILPAHWGFNIKDYINIKAIHKIYGQKKLKTFPFLDKKMKRYIVKSNVQIIDFLNWMPYRKCNAKKILEQEIGWRNYGGKHHENIWTRFFQVYILPKKFGVDKRKAHLSTLICSGQMTRAEAVAEMALPPYDEALLKADKDYILKKLGLTEEAFDAIMKLKPRSHWDFDFEGSIFHYYPILKPIRPVWKSLKPILGYRKDFLTIF